MLRAACSECTLLTIAHRLQTIIEYEQARRAREAYTRTFLPEYAPLRDQAQPQAASDT